MKRILLIIVLVLLVGCQSDYKINQAKCVDCAFYVLETCFKEPINFTESQQCVKELTHICNIYVCDEIEAKINFIT